MQEKISQEKRRATAKPPAARTGRIIGRDTAAGKGPNSTTSILATGCNKGLAIVLYGIQDSFGLPSGDHKQRMQQMMKEILIRKALSPGPPRRLTLRWRNFRPAPSRLSTMSTV